MHVISVITYYHTTGVLRSHLCFYLKGIAHMDATTAPRKYKLRTGLTSDRLYTSMAIVPPLLSRSGLLEVRAVSKIYEPSLPSLCVCLSTLRLADV